TKPAPHPAGGSGPRLCFAECTEDAAAGLAMSSHSQFRSRSRRAAPAERDCRQASRCRDCGEDVLWIVWRKSGRRMPINPQPKPAPYGQILVVYRRQTNELIAEKVRGKTPAGRRLFESHFATCSARDAA